MNDECSGERSDFTPYIGINTMNQPVLDRRKFRTQSQVEEEEARHREIQENKKMIRKAKKV
jgi:hypothetical protein